MSPEELKAVREKLRLSQAAFADYLQTGITTYQNWEQGRAKPNKQASKVHMPSHFQSEYLKGYLSSILTTTGKEEVPLGKPTLKT